jgi:DNA transformation protein and related proteins
MSVSNDFVAYVGEQLELLGRVTSRRMFGGVGLYADGLFFGLIADDTLYFKVDDSNRTDYLERGCKPFQPFPDKSDFSMSYYDVPADLLEDAEELSRWARKSLSVALATVNKKSSARRKKSTEKSRAPTSPNRRS